MFEGMWISLREGIEAALVAVMVISYLTQNNRAWMARYFYSGLASGVLAAAVFAFLSAGSEMLLKNQLMRIFVLIDGLLLFSALFAFIRSLGIDLLAVPGRILAGFKVLQGILLWLGASLLVFFNGLAVFLQLKSLANIKQNPAMVFGSAFLGLIMAFGAGFLLARFSDRIKLGRFFAASSLLLSIFTVKLLGGGVKGFAEVAIIQFVQKRLIKLGHDIVHEFIQGFLFPDHPFLKTKFWNFVGFFFGENTILTLMFLIMGGPTIYLIWKALTKPLPVLAEVKKGSERRKQLAALKKERWFQSIPVAAAFVIIFVFVISAGASPVDPVYDPEPQPVMDNGSGVISVPLTGPVSNISDGRLHKWSYRSGDKTIVFMAIKKPDGVVAVTLDLCEICQPEGYLQIADKFVLCKYCKTPIPLSTVGQPGGCNPVPLKADVGDRNLQISVEQLVSEYDKAMRGK